jgi:hypothetical protein
MDVVSQIKVETPPLQGPPPGQVTPKFPGFSMHDQRQHAEKAFERIINSEQGAEVGGKASMRRAVLARLAASLSVDDRLLDLLFQHILEDFAARYCGN